MKNIKKFNEEFDTAFGTKRNNVDNNKDMLEKALGGIFFYWGGDTPSEVFWGCNDLLDWYEATFDVNLGIRFSDENGNNFKDVIKAIKNS